jgi:hypothetical protein
MTYNQLLNQKTPNTNKYMNNNKYDVTMRFEPEKELNMF